MVPLAYFSHREALSPNLQPGGWSSNALVRKRHGPWVPFFAVLAVHSRLATEANYCVVDRAAVVPEAVRASMHGSNAVVAAGWDATARQTQIVSHHHVHSLLRAHIRKSDSDSLKLLARMHDPSLGPDGHSAIELTDNALCGIVDPPVGDHNISLLGDG